MKKLLFVLMIVVMLSFIFVGCLPVTPSEGEGEGEDEGESEIPAVSIYVEGEYADPITGDIWVRGCDNLDVTVTFAEAIEEGQNVWIRLNTGGKPFALLNSWILAEGNGTEFVAKDFNFPCTKDDCPPLCIEVMVGDVCCSEVIYHEVRMIDSLSPYALLYVGAEDCGPCDDTVKIIINSSVTGECGAEEGCCGDSCSGFASWTIDIFDEEPSGELCQLPCDSPVDSLFGTECPIFGETVCLEKGKYYVVATLLDNAGNQTKYFATVDTSIPCLPETVGIELAFPSFSDSYFTTSVSVSSDYDFLNGDFGGWCVDAFTYISVGTDYSNTNIYSSLDTSNLPDCIQERPWGSINWLINYWTTLTPPNTNVPFTWQEVQLAIWNLVHNNIHPDTCILQGCGGFGNQLMHDEDNVVALYASAYANSGYVPGSDELVAVILLVNGICPDGDTNTGNNDPDSKQMTFIGIPKNELDCHSLEVIEYIPNGQGCADWQNPVNESMGDLTIGNCGNFDLQIIIDDPNVIVEAF